MASNRKSIHKEILEEEIARQNEGNEGGGELTENPNYSENRYVDHVSYELVDEQRESWWSQEIYLITGPIAARNGGC